MAQSEITTEQEILPLQNVNISAETQSLKNNEVDSRKKSKMILNFILYILLHLFHIGIDSYIAYDLISRELPFDWWLFTTLFIFLPHFLKFLFTLISQPWPGLNLKQIVLKGQFSNISRALELIYNDFAWSSMFETLPGVHLYKRIYYFINYRNEPNLLDIKTDKGNIYLFTFHSGPQIVLQLAIAFQLNQITIPQVISIFLHTFFMLLSASRFYFSQRSEPQQDYSHRNILTICFFLSLILLTRLASFAVFFSYSRTFLSVPVIVLFGIAHLAMFYDQLMEEDKNFNQLDQLVLLLASCWAPCIPGLKKFYLIKTSLANFTLHILCHSIYLIHILTLQVLSVKYLPLRFHCFPTQIPELYGQYCIVENRTTILTQNCTLENGGEENLYAQMCLENESPNSDYLVTTLLIVLCLFTSLLPKFVLFKLEKNMSNLQSVFSCCKPNKHQSV